MPARFRRRTGPMSRSSPMTGFRVDLIRGAAIAVLALSCAAGAAGADPAARTAAGPPMALGGSPAPEATDNPESQKDTAADNGQAAIRVRSLGAVDGPPLGSLDSSNGGLGSDIWQDTARARVEEMLKRLPLATPFASVRALARRLVLTTADAPDGEAPHAFLSVRLRALLDAGMLDDAGSLAA